MVYSAFCMNHFLFCKLTLITKLNLIINSYIREHHGFWRISTVGDLDLN